MKKIFYHNREIILVPGQEIKVQGKIIVKVRFVDGPRTGEETDLFLDDLEISQKKREKIRKKFKNNAQKSNFFKLPIWALN